MEISKAEALGILQRGIEEIIDQNHFEKRILAGEKLRIKFGIDPTSPDIHFGHAVPLFKLRQFQNLGHKVILIIGDFTATIGDPSGRNQERRPLSEREVKQNLKNYLRQAGKIIDIKKTEVHHNTRWFKKEGIKTIIELARIVTIQQVLKREDFRKRIEAGSDVSFLETLYSLFQGYDSVKVKADVEIGGADQKLNLLMGRRVQRHFGQPEQDILTLPLLIGLDGTRKMSKSFGNYIAIDEKPEEMFGKIMSIPDKLTEDYFLLLTAISTEEIKKLKEKLSPKEFKMKLATAIISQISGAAAAEKATIRFKAVFQKHEIPEDAPKIKAKLGDFLIDVVLMAGLVSSRNEIKRLMNEGAISDFKIGKIYDYHFRLEQPLDLRIGKHRFLKIILD